MELNAIRDAPTNELAFWLRASLLIFAHCFFMDSPNTPISLSNLRIEWKQNSSVKSDVAASESSPSLPISHSTKCTLRSAMSEMIGGIGAGLFAVLLVAAIALLLACVVSYMFPDFTFFVFLGCAVLPVLTFAVIMSAPYEPVGRLKTGRAGQGTEAPTPVPKLPSSVFYPSDGQTSDFSDIVDEWFPVRVTMFVVAVAGVLLGSAYSFVLALTAPPYVAPQVQCLRRQLEQLHPTWYR